MTYLRRHIKTSPFTGFIKTINTVIRKECGNKLNTYFSCVVPFKIGYLIAIKVLASVKQFTAINYRIARIAVQALYCLTPDFFRILRPCSSATSMSVLSARFLS